MLSITMNYNIIVTLFILMIQNQPIIARIYSSHWKNRSFSPRDIDLNDIFKWSLSNIYF